MFIIRNATLEDVPALLRMARTVHSNNLPASERDLTQVIERSMASFAGDTVLDDRFFTFVLVDESTGHIAGTSAIIARRGTPARPRLYLKVRRHQHYSQDLQAGQMQTTVQLMQDTDGVTEVGGLVLTPAYRGGGQRLGSFLSRARFSFMGLHPDWFMNRIVAEVMGVLSEDGRTKLWDHLGRRFINLSYQEADTFSLTSKEFITSLFPEGEIYISLMPAEARNLIGAVSPDAVPALRMLERLGFEQVDEVDPFDGGPYLTANRDSIPLVASTATVELVGHADCDGPDGFISLRKDDEFRCIRSPYDLSGGRLTLPASAADALHAHPGDAVGFTPAPSPTTPRNAPSTDSDSVPT
jgi:arginine N-succinyltransferase